MIFSLTSVFVALAIGLPIFALGERVRGRRERRLSNRHTHLPERTSHEQILDIH